jgi:hypothetical protein
MKIAPKFLLILDENDFWVFLLVQFFNPLPLVIIHTLDYLALDYPYTTTLSLLQ